MKGDKRVERAKKRTNEHLGKLVKASVEKAEAEKKAKLDKDMVVISHVSTLFETHVVLTTAAGVHWARVGTVGRAEQRMWARVWLTLAAVGGGAVGSTRTSVYAGYCQQDATDGVRPAGYFLLTWTVEKMDYVPQFRTETVDEEAPETASQDRRFAATSGADLCRPCRGCRHCSSGANF